MYWNIKKVKSNFSVFFIYWWTETHAGWVKLNYSLLITSCCSLWRQCLLVCTAPHPCYSGSQTLAHTHRPGNFGKSWTIRTWFLIFCACESKHVRVQYSCPTHLFDSPLWTLAARCAVPAEVHCEVCTWHCPPHTLRPLLAWRTHSAITWHKESQCVKRFHLQLDISKLSILGLKSTSTEVHSLHFPPHFSLDKSKTQPRLSVTQIELYGLLNVVFRFKHTTFIHLIYETEVYTPYCLLGNTIVYCLMSV